MLRRKREQDKYEEWTEEATDQPDSPDHLTRLAALTALTRHTSGKYPVKKREDHMKDANVKHKDSTEERIFPGEPKVSLQYSPMNLNLGGSGLVEHPHC